LTIFRLYLLYIEVGRQIPSDGEGFPECGKFVLDLATLFDNWNRKAF